MKNNSSEILTLLGDTSKAIKAQKTGESMMCLKLSYTAKLVLPYKDGLALAASLEKAMIVEKEWGKPERVRQPGQDDLSISYMSNQEYQDILMAGLLGVESEEIKKAREEAEKIEAQSKADAFRAIKRYP